jgi:hypothetical protein
MLGAWQPSHTAEVHGTAHDLKLLGRAWDYLVFLMVIFLTHA